MLVGLYIWTVWFLMDYVDCFWLIAFFWGRDSRFEFVYFIPFQDL